MPRHETGRLNLAVNRPTATRPRPYFCEGPVLWFAVIFHCISPPISLLVKARPLCRRINPPHHHPDQQLVALADAAWSLLATHHIDRIDLAMVANLAAVPHGLAAALGGSVQRLVLAKMAQLDRQAIMETYADIEDAGDVSIREKITEGLLHRFEVYAPFRAQVNALNQAICTHPELAMRLLDGLESVVRRILVMSGDDAKGITGMMRVKGVIGVCLAAGRVWMTDDSP